LRRDHQRRRISHGAGLWWPLAPGPKFLVPMFSLSSGPLFCLANAPTCVPSLVASPRSPRSIELRDNRIPQRCRPHPPASRNYDRKIILYRQQLLTARRVHKIGEADATHCVHLRRIVFISATASAKTVHCYGGVTANQFENVGKGRASAGETLRPYMARTPCGLGALGACPTITQHCTARCLSPGGAEFPVQMR
jgi:hypothetical protein